MTSYASRALQSEAALSRIAQNAERDVSKLGAHSILLEAALRVILKHDLLDDFVSEHARPPGPRSARAMCAEDIGIQQ